jgi:hypothetical protein
MSDQIIQLCVLQQQTPDMLATMQMVGYHQRSMMSVTSNALQILRLCNP